VLVSDTALQPAQAKSGFTKNEIDQITAALAAYPIDSPERVDWAGQVIAAYPIDSPERVDWAGQVIAEIAAQRDAWTTERDSVAKPLRKIATRVSSRWKPAIDAADAAINTLKAAVKAYRDQVAAEQARALQAAAVEQDPETARAEIARTVQATAPVPSTLSERTVWKWEIEDASKIPADYYLLDEQRISREVRASKEHTKIPGIRVIRDTEIVRR